MKIRVYYEDTDLGGVVYHSKYLNFCERARSELFFEAGKEPVWQGYHFVVKELVAHYHLPAKLGELLDIETKLLEHKGAKIWLYQRILRNDELLYEHEIMLVCLKDDRPARIPRYFLEVLQ